MLSISASNERTSSRVKTTCTRWCRCRPPAPVHVLLLAQRPLTPELVLLAPLRLQTPEHVRREPLGLIPEQHLQCLAEISARDPPFRYSQGNAADTRGVRRTYGGASAEVNLIPTPERSRIFGT
jgi:hypothetical protein